MSTARVSSTVGGLRDDLLKISKEAPVVLRRVVVDGCRTGNSVARGFAKESAGDHGKLYPRAFSTEMHTTYRHGFGGGGNVYSGEYGPRADMPQGNMEFEWGSRNQPPHLDLNRSADLIGPSFAQETGDAVDRLFW